MQSKKESSFSPPFTHHHFKNHRGFACHTKCDIFLYSLLMNLWHERTSASNGVIDIVLQLYLDNNGRSRRKKDYNEKKGGKARPLC